MQKEKTCHWVHNDNQNLHTQKWCPTNLTDAQKCVKTCHAGDDIGNVFCPALEVF